MMRLVCSQAVHSSIRTHVEADAPMEACGLLVGKIGAGEIRITRVYPAPNLCRAPDQFEIDPKVRIALQRTLRIENFGESVIGHYHSHPNSAPIPSKLDLARAGELGLIWLIAGLKNGVMVAWGAYEACADGLISVPIRVEGEKNDIM